VLVYFMIQTPRSYMPTDNKDAEQSAELSAGRVTLNEATVTAVTQASVGV
jgi:hypothetical protein